MRRVKKSKGPCIVCWVEGPSEKSLLDVVVPKVLRQHLGERGFGYKCRTFKGRPDLMRKLERRMEHYLAGEGDCFLVLCDRDDDDCGRLKAELLAKIPERNRGRTVVRIAVRQLENFLLGDVKAVLEAEGLTRKKSVKQPNNPDKEMDPEGVLRGLMGRKYDKPYDAERIAKHLDLTEGANKSKSFQVLLDGVRTLADKA